MARKIGLGRGLSALIPEEDFPLKIGTGAVEAEIDVGSGVEPQPDPLELHVSPLESVEPEVRGSPLEPQPSPYEGVEPEVRGSPLDDISDEAAISALTSIEYVPVEPDVFDESEVSVEPEASVESEVSVEPEASVESEVSVEPEVSVESEVSVEPEASVESEVPVEPEASVESEVSVEPEASVESEVPVEPEASVESEVPVEPEASVESDVSVEPEVPVEPEASVEPEVPVSDEGGELTLSRDAVMQIAVDKLVPNPSQPRKNFDETELQELADSIKEHGIIMPIIAADTGDGNYTIIAGERRTRAARLAGLEDVPVIIRDYTDLKRMEVSLIENIQRSDLNPIEEATAYKNLMDFSSLSQGDLAARVGKNRSTVTNALRLLKLSAEVQKSLETGEISSGHARALLSVTDKKQRNKLFNEITAKGLSVREVEKKASALNSASEASDGSDSGGEKASKRPPEIIEMEEKFIEKLGTKVTIDGGLEKGRIHIEYYSMEDLDRLYGLLGD